MENTKIFLDTDVIINWIAKEEDPNTDFKLWIGPYEIIKLVENGEIQAYTSIINIFEIRFVLRRKKKFEEDKIMEFVSDLYSKININVPDSIDILMANQIQEENPFDPFDSMSYVVASTIPANVISRDRDFIEQVRSLDMAAYTPEEFLREEFKHIYDEIKSIIRG